MKPLMTEDIKRIYLIRDCIVMLDCDVAKLYGVSIEEFNLAVRRNRKRFPDGFMFELTVDEINFLFIQSVSVEERNLWQQPLYAFTKYGVAMLSSVLSSKCAILLNIAMVRESPCKLTPGAFIMGISGPEPSNHDKIKFIDYQ